jgi:hypothetical protein
MKSPVGTAMVVISCELPENDFRIPNSEICDYAPAGVLERFIRCGLAGNTQQGAGWKFPGVATFARVLSLWLVWSDRGLR